MREKADYLGLRGDGGESSSHARGGVDLNGLVLEVDADVIINHALIFMLGDGDWEVDVFCPNRVSRKSLELDDVAESRHA